MEADVIIIGAGAAGLRAAGILAADGLSVTVVEKDPQIGGRQKTRLIDGFVVDEGFHVFNPQYPEAEKALDYAALDLHYYDTGACFRVPGKKQGQPPRLVSLASPLHHPQRLTSLFSSGLVDPPSVAACIKWFDPQLASTRTYSFPTGNPDCTLEEGLDKAGLTGPMRRVFDTFFSALFTDWSAQTSNEFARVMGWLFLAGRAAIPGRGIAAIPAYLACQATSAGAQVLTGTEVVAVNRDETTPSVTLADGRTMTAKVVVVACDPDGAAGLMGTTPVPMNGLSTWWFAVDGQPHPSKQPMIDTTRSGPLSSTVVMSNINPALAPPGTSLIQATAAWGRSTDPAEVAEHEVRRHVADILGVDTRGWDLLARDDLPHALVFQQPGRPARTPTVDGGVSVCGDWCHSASFNGALLSAEQTAAAVVDHIFGRAR
ncbi:NAD(P)/FAD-dependent oxidoreductase [Corynebacterium mendelii]|uniref:FAD-dependent oxidoreductase n=1 Tax=Corynebacterium mendelii TaxID=2765362 RepID=A0A939E0W3_9CORY|nr:NAD(P)/FAD-dependent oxidoreductase [Corynebacterium mendelii]MBN9644400.1 FAD-dependent oxidoreductase [Corynebacterium mendelii]